MRRLVQRQQLAHGVHTTLKLKVAMHFIPWRNRQSGAPHRVAIAFQSVTGGGFILRAGDAGDLAVAAGDQMIGRHLAAQQRVILNNVVGALERRPVHHDDRQ